MDFSIRRRAPPPPLLMVEKEDACVVLKNDFICIPDADSNGNLKEADKASLVFVKHLILIILNVTKLEQCSFK